MRMSDWSSDVCSSDLNTARPSGPVIGSMPKRCRVLGEVASEVVAAAGLLPVAIAGRLQALRSTDLDGDFAARLRCLAPAAPGLLRLEIGEAAGVYPFYFRVEQGRLGRWRGDRAGGVAARSKSPPDLCQHVGHPWYIAPYRAFAQSLKSLK